MGARVCGVLTKNSLAALPLNRAEEKEWHEAAVHGGSGASTHQDVAAVGGEDRSMWEGDAEGDKGWGSSVHPSVQA